MEVSVIAVRHCVLCNKTPKISKRKPGFSVDGLCRSCFQRKKKFPFWMPNSKVESVDFDKFEAKDRDGNLLPKKHEFEWNGICGHVINTSCHKEHVKAKKANGHPWFCASCAIKQSWSDPIYYESHKQALKVGHNKPESRERHSKASRENFKNPTFVSKHRTYSGYRSAKSDYYKGILFRSSWEIKIATQLDLMGFKWEYEKEYFSLPSLDNRGYIPDFYLPEYDLYLEVKGWYNDYAQAQHKAFIQDHQKRIILIDRNHYNQICETPLNYLKKLIIAYENTTY